MMSPSRLLEFPDALLGAEELRPEPWTREVHGAVPRSSSERRAGLDEAETRSRLGRLDSALILPKDWEETVASPALVPTSRSPVETQVSDRPLVWGMVL